MVKLNSEMKNAFSKMRIFPLATASKDGVPNVIPIGFCKLQDDDETVWIADNFFLKTLENLRENPRVALYVWGPETQGCFQIKGHIEIKTSGEDYDKMHRMVKSMGDRFPARSLVVMKISEVYECVSGPDAGKKLL